MTRKKERFGQSLLLAGLSGIGNEQVIYNTIINIKFIDYEQKVFYAYDGGYVGCRLVIQCFECAGKAEQQAIG